MLPWNGLHSTDRSANFTANPEEMTPTPCLPSVELSLPAGAQSRTAQTRLPEKNREVLFLGSYLLYFYVGEAGPESFKHLVSSKKKKKAYT